MYNIICHYIDVNKLNKDKNEILKIIDNYCKSKNLYRHNIRLCDLPLISKLININITSLRKDRSYYVP